MEIIGFIAVVIIALLLTFTLGFCLFADLLIGSGPNRAADCFAFLVLASAVITAWWLVITESPFKIVAQ